MPEINIEAMFHAEHERAKSSRAADGFKDESFIPHAIVIDPEGKIIMIACPFKNNTEKTMAMQYIWTTAVKEKAAAVLFSSDSRQIENKAYCKHYGISLEEFEEHRLQKLRELGGSFGNLPREVWIDSLVTWAIGPNLPNGLLTSSYTEGPDDTVVFNPTVDGKDHITKQYLMPKWW